MSKYILFPVVVCTHQSDGAPAFHVCTPEVTQEQIDNGDHYDMAIANASDLGYEGGAVAFDLTDPAVGQLEELVKMVCEAVSGTLALEILALDGGTILGEDGSDPRAEQCWTFESKDGTKRKHRCISQGNAALMFVTEAYPCSQNEWLKDVCSGVTVDSYAEWLEAKLRGLRLSLRKQATEGAAT